MYAEIKSNNKILINRVDDSERILLKDIFESSKSKDIKLQEIISDDGEFGGVFLVLEDKQEDPIDNNSENNNEENNSEDNNEENNSEAPIEDNGENNENQDGE